MTPHILESPDEILSTLHKDGKRRWLYPQLVKGFWFHRRLILAWTLIVLYIVLPFAKINGKQALMLGVIDRKFHIFGVTFFATDTQLLWLFGLSVVFSILWTTALFGRAWCGWACPQTVYLEFVYRPIERLIEGSESRRAKRDQAGASLDWFLRKALKFVAYTVVSALLANVFVAYFVGSERLLTWVTRSPLEHPEAFLLMAGVTGAMLFNFGYFREQLCTIACPYARLQSALLDYDSLCVQYDRSRGEPRAKGKNRENLGDCIDCGMCVRVCPTGIDIRNGLQMECLHCTQCIDACDSVMEKVHLPPGLIGYGSHREAEAGQRRYLRPRVAVYSMILLVVTSAFAIMLKLRKDFEAQLLRKTGEPYTQTGPHAYANHLQVRLRNLTDKPITLSISNVPLEGVGVIIPEQQVVLPGNSFHLLTAFVQFSDSLPIDKRSGILVVKDEHGETSNVDYPILGPNPNEN